MENRIYQIKDKLLTQIENETQNMERADYKMIGELSDAVHHLAEAEYYCSVADAMWAEKNGYTPQGSVTTARSGYNQMRSGYSAQSHKEVMEPLRAAIQNAGPDERNRLRNEVRAMIGEL